MTHQKIMDMLTEMEIPFAYDHFAEGESPDPPFMVFLYPKADNFSADGIPYYKINQLDIEIYTDLKNIEMETKVEAVIESYGIFYEKNETWIDSEKLYEVLYQFEMEGMNDGKEE